MSKKTVRDVTLPEPGDLLFPRISDEAMRALSIGQLPSPDVEMEEKPDDGMRVRVARVKIDGVWVNL